MTIETETATATEIGIGIGIEPTDEMTSIAAMPGARRDAKTRLEGCTPSRTATD